MGLLAVVLLAICRTGTHACLLSVLSNLLCNCCSAAAYLLDWELLNLLMAMMSTQLYTPTAVAAPNAHPFTAAILEQKDLVPGLLQVLALPCVLHVQALGEYHGGDKSLQEAHA